jgi:hypothetical protein
MIRRILRRTHKHLKDFLDKYEFEYRIAVIIALGYLFYIYYG